MRPQPRMQFEKACKYSHHEYTGFTRHSPHDGFNGYCALSLVRRAFWPPSPALSSRRL